jgi:citrate synthase
MTIHNATWVDADEAIKMLGVSRATLYAYVSRGRIRSEPTPGASRRRRYSLDDVERLVARTRERRNPEKAAEQALDWGLPILESAITMIAGHRIYYRGYDASDLARTSSVAEVAALLWRGQLDAADLAGAPRTAVPRRAEGVPFIAAAESALALAAAGDALGYDRRPAAVVQTGWRILWLLARIAANGARPEATIDETLAAGWGVQRRYVHIIRAALILCADHELNVSTFTARCVASAGGSPYGAVIAGLAALEGAKHGGTTARVETLWDSLRRSRDLRAALLERLRSGEPIEGFGHKLYADGDPRAAVLLDLLPSGKNAAFARELAGAVREVLGDAPNVDFALVAAARALGLPNGAALTLFAIGRTLGWIGHAVEQYERDAMIRPRAKYVGRPPAGA